MIIENFLQSPEWEQLQNEFGRKTWRAAKVLVIRHDLPAGFNYLYAPAADAGPNAEVFFNEAEKIAREEKSIFFKVEPISSVLPSRGGVRFSHNFQPQRTILVDLMLPEEGILAAMHPKTRYNIRLAEKRGVVVSSRSASAFVFKTFCGLLAETAARDKFGIHEKRYYEKLLEMRSDQFSNELFFAEHDGAVRAAAMVNFYYPSKTATYIHGASSSHNRAVMAPYLLHWRIMQEARGRGFALYDFGGIDAEKWPGVTRFKQGFGGAYIERPKAVDVVYRPALYQFYKFARKLF